MSNRPELKPQTPGAKPVPEKQMPPQAIVEEQKDANVPPVEEQPEAKDIALDVASLTDDQLMALAAEVKRRSKKQAQGALPNQEDIDPAKITRPQLSKQGWVCPLPKPNPKQMV